MTLPFLILPLSYPKHSPNSKTKSTYFTLTSVSGKKGPSGESYSFVRWSVSRRFETSKSVRKVSVGGRILRDLNLIP